MIVKIALFGIPIYEKYEFKGINERNTKILAKVLNKIIEAESYGPLDIVKDSTTITAKKQLCKKKDLNKLFG